MVEKSGLNFEDLNDETKDRLGLLKTLAINPKLTAISSVIRTLKGLNTREALQVLREVERLIIAERDRDAYRKSQNAKKEIVDER